MKRLVEVRSYRLKPGRLADLHALFTGHALPLLRAAGMDVVAAGASPHETDAYFLVRSFADLADRDRQQDAFYGSAIWREGPREAILDCIDAYLDALLWLGSEAVEDLRRSNAS